MSAADFLIGEPGRWDLEEFIRSTTAGMWSAFVSPTAALPALWTTVQTGATQILVRDFWFSTDTALQVSIFGVFVPTPGPSTGGVAAMNSGGALAGMQASWGLQVANGFQWGFFRAQVPAGFCGLLMPGLKVWPGEEGGVTVFTTAVAANCACSMTVIQVGQ